MNVLPLMDPISFRKCPKEEFRCFNMFVYPRGILFNNFVPMAEIGVLTTFNQRIRVFMPVMDTNYLRTCNKEEFFIFYRPFTIRGNIQEILA